MLPSAFGVVGGWMSLLTQGSSAAAVERVVGYSRWWTVTSSTSSSLLCMPSKMPRQAGWHLPFSEEVRASEETPCRTGAWHWPLCLRRSRKRPLPKEGPGFCGVLAVEKLHRINGFLHCPGGTSASVQSSCLMWGTTALLVSARTC